CRAGPRAERAQARLLGRAGPAWVAHGGTDAEQRARYLVAPDPLWRTRQRQSRSGPPIPSQDDGAAAPALAVASAAARPCWTACLDPAALTVELDRSAFPLCRSHEPSPGNLPRSAFA
ncbi:MAG TPA: hypothetical protein VER03_22200, partial [Bryobacteraceae bacterium]|nr:hypothetical protein [Bryobacteraceae bacterium]